MSVLLFFGKNRFEKHKTGLFDGLRSTIPQNTNFTLFLGNQSPLSKTGDDKKCPLHFLGWNKIFTVATIINGGYCRSKTGT